MLETLDAATVRRWCGGGLKALRAHQHEIDELNVYPVPDGDTGTNLVLTLTSAHEALEALEVLEALEAVEALKAREAAPAAGDGPFQGAAADETAAAGTTAGGAAADRLAADGPAALASDGAAATSLGRTMRRMARGALLGARGNSGVIVSQILRGMADAFAGSVAVRGVELARALRSASEAAYAAVSRPVEGTVLSVVAAAAEGAGRIRSDDLLAVARAAARAASEALARTPQQLPILARAGVVDAGGRGLCVLLDALVEALTPADPALGAAVLSGGAATGRPGVGDAECPEAGISERLENGFPEQSGEGAPERRGASPAGSVAADPPGGPAGRAGGFGFEVQYLLEAADGPVDELRRLLDGLGDSLVIVGSGDGGIATWNVHVHVGAAQIGPAIEAAVRAGRPHRISVTPLDEHGHRHHARHEPEQGRRDRSAESDHDAHPADESAHEAIPPRPAESADPAVRGAVVVAAGDGLTALFEAEGATVVDRNPSIREMLVAIAETGAGSVVLLPNDANTHAVASSAAREAEAGGGVRVSVVPTRSPVQALAALAVRDPARPFSDDVIAMAEAAGACRYGEVCTAQRDSLTVAGPCRAGDLLGLVDGEVHVIGADLADVSRRLLDRMLGGGGELATLVLGADAPVALEESLRGHLAQAWPFVEPQCYAGGQPRYHLLVGVE